MKVIEVNAEKRYEVVTGIDWRESIAELTKGREYRVIAPSSLRDQLIQALPESQMFFAPNGEAQKSFEYLEKVLEYLAQERLTRDAVLVAVGGGATTDLVGFAASIYLRGIDWIAIPTSLAGMVDASIGGKTGINLAAGKNLAGTFYSPTNVLIDFNWLQDLPARDVNAGLAESVKCGFIADSKILDLIEENVAANLAEIIERSVSVKAKVVSSDFRESGEREILNYGHTLGHAIEKDANYDLRHGEAISIGMVFVAALSVELEGLSGEVLDRHKAILKKLGLPLTYKKDAWDRLYSLMLSDKKRKSGEIRFVTLIKEGKCGRKSSPEGILRNVYFKEIGLNL
ncbi:MAG: hypothetical protein RIR40_529 [Actinomycetota bacterium]|jgi:3-dehydroquinate synthase